jgi:hypothetical protein
MRKRRCGVVPTGGPTCEDSTVHGRPGGCKGETGSHTAWSPPTTSIRARGAESAGYVAERPRPGRGLAGWCPRQDDFTRLNEFVRNCASSQGDELASRASPISECYTNQSRNVFRASSVECRSQSSTRHCGFPRSCARPAILHPRHASTPATITIATTRLPRPQREPTPDAIQRIPTSHY